MPIQDAFGAAVDAMPLALPGMIAEGQQVKDVATTGLSDAAIRKAAVVAVLGDAALSGKSDAYVDARFDILSEDAAKGDTVADALTQAPAQVTSLDDAYAARDTALNDAWKPAIVKGA